MTGNCADCDTDTMTYIDVVLLVAQKEVVHDGGLVQFCQRGHVLHPMDAAGVHRVHRLPVELGLLQVGHLEGQSKHNPERQSSSGRKGKRCTSAFLINKCTNEPVCVFQRPAKSPKPQTPPTHLHQREATNPHIKCLVMTSTIY